MKKTNNQKLKVLHITSELTPLAKACGLGDIVGALPKEMATSFHQEVKIIMPKYKNFDQQQFGAEKIIEEIKIPFTKKQNHKVAVWKTFIPETIIPVYLIDAPKIFTSEEVYGNKVRGKSSNYAYFFLSKVALELIKAIDWCPNIIHIHDWMIGLVPKWLKTIYAHDPFYKHISTILTIHNLAHQQLIPKEELKEFKLKRKDFQTTRKLLKTKKFNIMAEAISSSDFVNTVSPTYAREILTKKYGSGLHRLLSKEKAKFTGILNGIDYTSFDPRINEDTPVKYWIETLDKKVENKMILQKKFGLTQTGDLPLISVISRLTPQKGLDLVEDVLKDLVDMGAQFVILGSGQEKIEKIFIKAEKENPKSIEAEMEFDANLAQTIYAGSDMLLMPSRFEPCGLSQIIAMRFGTIPIVRGTGGLADTVRDGYTGFVFRHYDKNAFLWAIIRAVDVYYNQKDFWRRMQIRAMKKDFSWKNSAKKYIWAYKKAISNHKKYLEENAQS